MCACDSGTAFSTHTNSFQQPPSYNKHQLFDPISVQTGDVRILFFISLFIFHFRKSFLISLSLFPLALPRLFTSPLVFYMSMFLVFSTLNLSSSFHISLSCLSLSLFSLYFSPTHFHSNFEQACPSLKSILSGKVNELSILAAFPVTFTSFSPSHSRSWCPHNKSHIISTMGVSLLSLFFACCVAIIIDFSLYLSLSFSQILQSFT
ncbi:unnamed protein product [Acanthosepion pharaonis]|uniref:Uncharacterized protein n=1 Tax=Acanthosepion pharaonis TaxID=158019 RepID=A0A812AKD7_ACAPH|nr:unnamed protein product [Sepia pharaonis]